MILAHQVGGDPLHLHEVLVILAAIGGSISLAVYWLKDWIQSRISEIKKLFRSRR